MSNHLSSVELSYAVKTMGSNTDRGIPGNPYIVYEICSDLVTIVEAADKAYMEMAMRNRISRSKIAKVMTAMMRRRVPGHLSFGSLRNEDALNLLLT